MQYDIHLLEIYFISRTLHLHPQWWPCVVREKVSFLRSVANFCVCYLWSIIQFVNHYTFILLCNCLVKICFMRHWYAKPMHIFMLIVNNRNHNTWNLLWWILVQTQCLMSACPQSLPSIPQTSALLHILAPPPPPPPPQGVPQASRDNTEDGRRGL